MIICSLDAVANKHKNSSGERIRGNGAVNASEPAARPAESYPTVALGPPRVCLVVLATTDSDDDTWFTAP